MPIYEYACRDCGYEMDALQKIADAPLVDCPQCGNPSLKKKISAPSFRLKGQGWYETDFKSDKDKRRNLADGGDKKSDKGTGEKSEKKSEKSSKSSGSGEAA
ncbi:MAG: zinc ribbon domain-containing protein [Pseudomonadota bacterium]